MGYDCKDGMMISVFAFNAPSGHYIETRKLTVSGAYQARLIPSTPYGIVSAYCEGVVELVETGTSAPGTMGFDHLAPYPDFPNTQALLGLAGLLGGLVFRLSIRFPFAKRGGGKHETYPISV